MSQYFYSKRLKFTMIALTSAVFVLVLFPILYILQNLIQIDTFEILTTKRIVKIIFNTVILTLSVTILSTLLGLLSAFVFEGLNPKLKNIFYTLFVTPMAIPSYIGAFALLIFLSPNGLLFDFLNLFFNISNIPLINGFWGALIVLTVFTYPYTFINTINSFKKLDIKLVESARILGESNFSILRKIIFPHLLSSIFSSMIITALYTLSDFGAVSLMRYNTLTRAIFVEFTTSFDRSNAALLSSILVFMSLLVYIIIGFLNNKFQNTSKIKSKKYFFQNNLYRLNPYFVNTYSLLLIFISTLIPFISFLYLIVRSNKISFDLDFRPIYNSIILALVVAFLVVLISFVVTFTKVKFFIGGRKIISFIANINYVFPSLVISLSFVFIFARYIDFFYQTFIPVILALVIKYLPQANLNLEPFFSKQSRKFEESAAVMGESDLGLIKRAIIPQLRSVLFSNYVIAFVNILKELPIILILSPIGFKTITEVIWASSENVNYDNVALYSLILIAISCSSIIIFYYSQYKDNAENKGGI